MLEEAVTVIRSLLEGDWTSRQGPHYSVENARIYDVPDEPVPIYIAASGEKAAELAGRIGDGLIGLSPDEDFMSTFDEAGGRGKPRLAEVQVCWNESEEAAVKVAKEWWPNVAVPGELGQELPLPRHFEQASENVSDEDIAEKVACGPDAHRHLEMIHKYADAGYSHVWVHQIGPDQDGFFEFYEDQILPKL